MNWSSLGRYSTPVFGCDPDKWMVGLLSTDIGRRDLTARSIGHMDGTDACALHASVSCALHAEAPLDSLRRLAPESERQVLVCEVAVA
jgi:hypothetical protein